MSDSADDIAVGADTWEPSPYLSHTSTRLQANGHLDAPSLNGLSFIRVDGVPLMPAQTALRSSQLMAKRLVDMIAAALLLLAFGPLLIAIALVVKLTSRGPVFFLQERVGFGGATFLIFKFRTMFVDRGDASGVAQTVAGDPRVTPVGRLLRQWSLDELPQLINVLLGNMSLVGPRPHVPGQLAAGVACEEVIPYYGLRHQAKPGITGWAQVNGYRGPTDTVMKARRRVDHDLAYIQNYSLLLDIKILLLTVVREFVTGSGS
jgi:lipopolysaccharide/colanic/teichoic acid biosynthesis glycosyltransferase